MKIMNLILVAVGILLSPSAWAVESRVQTDKNCYCNKDQNDPYEDPSAFAFGKFKGQCLDSCRFRPVKLLNSKSQNSWDLANILHLGQFYKTTIKSSQIKSVSVGFETFTRGVHHVTLRFQFYPDQEAELTPQVGESKSKLSVSSLIFSSEGAPAKGVNYSLMDSFLGHYLIIARVVSGAEYNAWTSRLKNPVQFYSVPLTVAQTHRAFHLAVESGSATGKNDIYQLLTNNCATKAISILMKARFDRPFQSLPWMSQITAALSISGPINTFHFLKNSDLLTQSD